jgi:pimeloyl-ACP methyl ester carboxylesterase
MRKVGFPLLPLVTTTVVYVRKLTFVSNQFFHTPNGTMAPVQSSSLYPILSGELFAYAPGRVAFESFHLSGSCPNKCILLGGLSDGLMPVPYTQKLFSELSPNWSLVQPILSSSYTGFGHGSLDRDMAELDELIEFLTLHRGAEYTALVGHSTGAQDIVHYLKHGNPVQLNTIRLVALQAPVSDRESSTICYGCHDTPTDHLEDLQKHIKLAQEMVESKREDEMMPRCAFWAPITASRYLALHERDGTDDYFSSDFDDGELKRRLQHVGQQKLLLYVLVAFSGSDEYVPSCTGDSEKLLLRLCRSMTSDNPNSPEIVPLFLEEGNHNLSSRNGADAEIFVSKLKDLLQSSIL